MLEVIALNVDDARKAEEGGANQLELVGTMDKDGLSPSPALVDDVVAAVDIPVRPMLRLRDGFATDADEIEQLEQLAVQYAGAGAAGVVLGFLTPDSQIGIAVLEDILSVTAKGMDFTFHRAIDYAADGVGNAACPRTSTTAHSDRREPARCRRGDGDVTCPRQIEPRADTSRRWVKS